MNFLICLGIFLTPNLPEYVKFSALTHKTQQRAPIDPYTSRFITVISFILGRLLLE